MFHFQLNSIVSGNWEELDQIRHRNQSVARLEKIRRKNKKNKKIKKKKFAPCGHDPWGFTFSLWQLQSCTSVQNLRKLILPWKSWIFSKSGAKLCNFGSSVSVTNSFAFFFSFPAAPPGALNLLPLLDLVWPLLLLTGLVFLAFSLSLWNLESPF